MVAGLPLKTLVEDNGGEWNLLDLSMIDRQVCIVVIPVRESHLFQPSSPTMGPEGDTRHVLEGSSDGRNELPITFSHHSYY